MNLIEWISIRRRNLLPETGNGPWEEKYNSYPPVYPSGQTFALSSRALQEERGQNWREEKNGDSGFDRNVPVKGICRWRAAV